MTMENAIIIALLYCRRGARQYFVSFIFYSPFLISNLQGDLMNKNPQTKESIPAGLLSLAMAFVPTQEFDTPYDPVLAFSRGTIFPALDKPFLGEEAVPQ